MKAALLKVASRVRLAVLPLVLGLGLTAQERAGFADWTVFIANDTCPDYTWGNDEAQTRKNFAELVRSHLEEMTRTDHERPENRDHYNLAVTMEALCFLEFYPERKAELVRRLKEGRLFLSPFLCNTLWGFQSVEGALRGFYPARRLEREWGVPIDVAHHIEQPALPWGVPTVLAGCGIRWVNVPFLDYDCAFGRLKNPPAFVHEGPDGSQVRVLLDVFASEAANYTQGAHLLGHPGAITNQWLPHYQELGNTYPARAVLASGTHGDTCASSAGQTRGFAQAIITYNAGPAPRPRLANSTFRQFFQALDQSQSRTPFLPTVRGCFGHSWDLWPVSLAKCAAEARQHERQYLAAESLLALGCLRDPQLAAATRSDRERAEYCWAMLADHAWNGADDANRRENARLRQAWNLEFSRLTAKVAQQAWAGLGLTPSDRELVVFNNLSSPRADLARAPVGFAVGLVTEGKQRLSCQSVEEDGQRILYFVTPRIAGFGWRHFQLKAGQAGRASPKGPAAILEPAKPEKAHPEQLRATATELESPYYRLKLDPKTGGVASLVHKASGAELVTGQNGRTLGQTVFWDGQEHTIIDASSEVLAAGPVLARLRVAGTLAGIRVTNLISLYAELDRVDFELRISKPPTTSQQRLCQVFPVFPKGAQLRLETPAAVIRPEPQPKGDLVPGADTRRFAVQAFVDASLPAGPGATIASLDAFVLRADLEPITFEAAGNDQNYKEVLKDQNGVTEFRFRYVLRGHQGAYDNAAAIAWSRAVSSPLTVAEGRLPQKRCFPPVAIDPQRAIATCLKPADDLAAGGIILRLWEVGGGSGPLRLEVNGCRRALQADLLERDRKELPVKQGHVDVELRAHGLASVRLMP